MRAGLRELVIERDRQRCRRCRQPITGSCSVHHRKLRSQGGVDCACNLLLLCGSGTTGCHGYVHAHPAESRELGLLVSAYAVPLLVPVLDGALLVCSELHDDGLAVLSDRRATVSLARNTAKPHTAKDTT